MAKLFFSASILLLFIIFFPFPSRGGEQVCHPSDVRALLKIKAALNNPSEMASWNGTTADCCSTLYAILNCDSTTNRVNRFVIEYSHKLNGRTIPSAISELTYLTWISFQGAGLVGSIPPSFIKLKYLQVLLLSGNRLSGPIPEFLGRMQSLTLLQLTGNRFSGTIPASLSGLRNLTSLLLSNNNLTGTIPNSFGNFSSQFQLLELSDNRLSGEIPRSLGYLESLSAVHLWNNEFRGDASFLFGSNKSTREMYLSNNALEFNFSDVGIPSTLFGLDISRNKIFGSIPQGLATITNLYFLNVSDNNLCGEIPQGGKLQSFDTSAYLNNKCLCGKPLANC